MGKNPSTEGQLKYHKTGINVNKNTRFKYFKHSDDHEILTPYLPFLIQFTDKKDKNFAEKFFLQNYFTLEFLFKN